MKHIKIGDRVRSISHWVGIEGFVEDLNDWADAGPLNVENHGIIEIRLTWVDPKRYKYLKAGDLAHFVLYEWWKALEVIEEDK